MTQIECLEKARDEILRAAEFMTKWDENSRLQMEAFVLLGRVVRELKAKRAAEGE